MMLKQMFFLHSKVFFPKKEGGSGAFSQSLKIFCEIFTCDFLTWFMSSLLDSNPQHHQDTWDWSWMGSHNEMVSGNQLEVKSNNYHAQSCLTATSFSSRSFERHLLLWFFPSRQKYTFTFNLSSSISSSPLVLIHSDIWTSPYYSIKGSKYYVLFLGDNSKYSWIVPVHFKHET